MKRFLRQKSERREFKENKHIAIKSRKNKQAWQSILQSLNDISNVKFHLISVFPFAGCLNLSYKYKFLIENQDGKKQTTYGPSLKTCSWYCHKGST